MTDGCALTVNKQRLADVDGARCRKMLKTVPLARAGAHTSQPKQREHMLLAHHHEQLRQGLRISWAVTSISTATSIYTSTSTFSSSCHFGSNYFNASCKRAMLPVSDADANVNADADAVAVAAP